jgi:hypothetical protein
MKRAQCGETSFGAYLGRPYAEGVRLALRRRGAQTGILVEEFWDITVSRKCTKYCD